MAFAVTPVAVAPPFPFVASYCLQGGIATETPAWRPSERHGNVPCWAGTTAGTAAGPAAFAPAVGVEAAAGPAVDAATCVPVEPVAPVAPVAAWSPGPDALADSVPLAALPAVGPVALTLLVLLLALPGSSVTSRTRA